MADDSAHQRHPPGAARPPPQPPLCCRRSAVPGPGHRRQHRHLHAHRPDSAAQTAGARARRTGDALSAGGARRQQHGVADALLPDVPRVPEAGRTVERGAGPPAGRDLGDDRGTDRTPGGRTGVGQLLLGAGRRPGRRPGLQLAGRRPRLPGPPGRGHQPRVLAAALCRRAVRRRHEDPGQQLPDDHRRGVGRRLCRPRPDAFPAASRPHPDAAGGRPGMVVAQDGRRAHALGAGVRTAQAGLHRGLGARSPAGAVPADPRTRDDAAGGQGLHALHPRAVHAGHADRRARGHGLLVAAQRLLDAARGADVHGRSGAAHRLRQRGQPAHRPRLHAAAGDRRALVARRDPASAGAPAPHREPAAGLRRRGPGPGPGLRHDAGACSPIIPVEGAPLLVSPAPDSRILAFTFTLTLITGVVFGLLPALRASRPDTWSTLKDTGGAVAGSGGSLVPAQGPGGRTGGPQLPAAVRRRPVRAEPAEPEGHRHRRGPRQPGHLPALAGPERLRRPSRPRALRAAPGAAAAPRPASSRRPGPPCRS